MTTDNYRVRVKCTVIKELEVGPCTRELVERDPFERCLDETKETILNWEIEDIRPMYVLDARKQV